MQKKNKPKIGIVYVPFTYIDYVKDIFDSWQMQDYPADRISIYIVPNGAPDTVEVLNRELQNRPDMSSVHIIDDGVNHGFAGGHNIGMKAALEDGCDYIFLNNGDLKLGEGTLTSLVERLESDRGIGSIQPLIRYWKNADLINTSGGVAHIFGYAYGRDNLRSINDAGDFDAGIAYASGAAVMYRSEVLIEVGLLEEGFFMYHEDFEMGLRLLISGYKNRLDANVSAFHDYEFKRNPGKFGWMELYRWMIVLGYFRIGTLALLLPVMLLHEISTWLFALKGGWFRAKLWQYMQLLHPRTYALLFKIRARTKSLRKISDRELLRYFTGNIEAQEQSSWIVERIGNPVISTYLRCIKVIIFW